ncbi:Fc.00g064210.m01.CDS01 [Cosmosporella sp. VM-42]
MPSPLDLSHSTHSKMMVAPPRINLRRAASYNTQDRGPISSTSARFSFNHLLFSPPPSPSLPSLVPRPKKRPSQILVTRPSQVIRRLVYLIGLFSTVYLLGLVFHGHDVMPAAWPYFANEEFEMVGQDAVPDFPTPIVVSDSRGHSKWTVSIPPDYDFPLSVRQYSDMSGQCREVSARARDLHQKKPLAEETILNYDAPDDYFVDVYEAERTGLLPSSGKGILAKDGGQFVGMDKATMARKPICQTSMTFVLETPDAGLGNSLMMLWTFYGLAKEQGRDFFIDDTRWAYGNYAEIFQAPPIPECRPPPRYQMVPCPFQARHLVVSAVTAKEVFPALLAKNHRMTGTDNGLQGLFELARTGYQDMFALTDGDQKYVDNRVRQIREKPKVGETKATHAPVIGLHIRHGDRHPLEYQYREGYIPNEVFLETVGNIVEAHYNKSDNEAAHKPSITLLASDDPTVRENPDFAKALAAQDRIRLASKGAIEEANPNPQVLHHFVDETFGWEGGFFAPMFWNLGVERKNNAANAPTGLPISEAEEETKRAPPSDQTLKLRSFIGRAYMMDLAVLAGGSDKVVCAVSAMGCRLLAVMMGWENAIDAEGWVNVDGSYGWTGINW